ncbi:MAG: D-tyrosyl-tRNA(Tyr) deacylase [Gemmatimonadota bacterium]|nr:MAG: D-tyrosyl-tRNA(Tyr) deacylase [Gemmatimonadota bacterium]
MRVLLQRVRKASVSVEGTIHGSIVRGCVLLVGVGPEDTERDAAYLADKCANLRIFEDREGKMNLSALDVGGEALVISQFTLYGDCRNGRRPSFTDAAPPEKAETLYETFMDLVRRKGIRVEGGRFGAKMLVEIWNDGPVTLLLESGYHE